MEGFKNKYDIAKRAGFGVVNAELNNLYMIESMNRGKEADAIYISLNKWNLAGANTSGQRAVQARIRTLMNVFKAFVYVK